MYSTRARHGMSEQPALLEILVVCYSYGSWGRKLKDFSWVFGRRNERMGWHLGKTREAVSMAKERGAWR